MCVCIVLNYLLPNGVACCYRCRAETVLALQLLLSSPERNTANPLHSRVDFLAHTWRAALAKLLHEFC